MLEMFTDPKGVAVVGASTSPDKLGYQVLRNVIQYGYQGAIYPINPTAAEILGLKAYPTVLECPDPVDLAVVLVPNKVVPTVMEQCGQRGLKGAVVISPRVFVRWDHKDGHSNNRCWRSVGATACG